MLLWGAAQPFVGAIADRFGPVLVLCIGALLYAIGFAWMVFATTPGAMYLSAGVLIGFGLAGSSFTVVIGAFGKLLPVGMAHLFVRARHRRRLVRAVPVLAARGRAEFQRSTGRRRC